MSQPIEVDRQLAVDFDALPTRADIERWLAAVFSRFQDETRRELTVRFVEERESRQLNATWRGRDYATNVLSFPFEAPPGLALALLGDLVISPHVVVREAREQGKRSADHFVHMIVHGTLHLLGFDHIEDDEAETMEQLERDILADLGIDDPYAWAPVTPQALENNENEGAFEDKRTDA
ncbi:rRNA maturation RNase YbeY [Kushneria aurantia]|uniref:Endoribonuclease YbeY n=1 Tax=Kushneria aurantia TaxID=504092 RepID=A0ABV6G3M4_9GAMM|nr:rRNA maturation RNase YbeY [Kushneria aurantia]